MGANPSCCILFGFFKSTFSRVCFMKLGSAVLDPLYFATQEHNPLSVVPLYILMTLRLN